MPDANNLTGLLSAIETLKQTTIILNAIIAALSVISFAATGIALYKIFNYRLCNLESTVKNGITDRLATVETEQIGDHEEIRLIKQRCDLLHPRALKG